MALRLGPPPFPVLLFMTVNTALVVVSEELMFRGVLLRGLMSAFSFWLSTATFGLVHLSNTWITGKVAGVAA